MKNALLAILLMETAKTSMKWNWRTQRNVYWFKLLTSQTWIGLKCSIKASARRGLNVPQLISLHSSVTSCNRLKKCSPDYILSNYCGRGSKWHVKASLWPKSLETNHYLFLHTSFVLPETIWYTERRLLHSGLSALSNSRLLEQGAEAFSIWYLNLKAKMVTRKRKKKLVHCEGESDIISTHPANESVLHRFILSTISYTILRRNEKWILSSRTRTRTTNMKKLIFQKPYKHQWVHFTYIFWVKEIDPGLIRRCGLGHLQDLHDSEATATSRKFLRTIWE